MKDFASRYGILTFLTTLAVLEFLVFSPSLAEFFQGDALFWLQHRYRSWSEFAGGLLTTDVANWYRPLSNRTIPALFFPWFGIDPYGYHWVVFILFFITTCAVFFFLRSIVPSFKAAAIGTLFFAIHSINVYVTYDFTFAPELLYTLFYVVSCFAFVRKRYGVSIAAFVLALMSKEAAVTLPANLLLIALLTSSKKRTLKWTVPHFCILAAYYAYFVRHLNVGTGDYVISFHSEIPRRLIDSFKWTFHFFGRDIGMTIPLLIATSVVIVYFVVSMFDERRRLTFTGLGWFVIGLSPMLGIVGYFAGYYLLLPLVGVALIVGLSFDWLFSKLQPIGGRFAVATVTMLLLPFFLASRLNADEERRANSSLGFAGQIARTSAADFKRAYPALQPNTTVLLLNPDEPDLWRYFGLDALIRLIYADDSVEVLYSSLGYTASGDLLHSDRLIVMKFENGAVRDVTTDFKSNPAAFITTPIEENHEYITSERFRLEVTPAEVVAGKGWYAVQISGAANTDAELQYRFNDGPIARITVHLNSAGKTRFFVSLITKRGEYEFVGFRIPPSTQWIRASQTVKVTD